MLRKQVWRYYCEHCKKAGQSGFHIRRHEAGCTLNFHRICGMCRINQEVSQADTGALIEAAHFGLGLLREVAQGCPACILTGIRQLRRSLGTPTYNEDGQVGMPGSLQDFDWRKEKAEWYDSAIALLNEENRHAVGY